MTQLPPSGSLFSTPAPVGGCVTTTPACARVETKSPLPVHNGTPTSIAAARSIVPHLNRLQIDVCAFIKDRGEAGATRDEIERGLGLAGSTVRPRVLELISRRLVCETANTRKTTTGRVARVIVYCGND